MSHDSDLLRPFTTFANKPLNKQSIRKYYIVIEFTSRKTFISFFNFVLFVQIDKIGHPNIFLGNKLELPIV